MSCNVSSLKNWSVLNRLTNHRQTSNISRNLVHNKLVDPSDVFGASPVGAAPTISSFSTSHPASTDWARKTAKRDGNHLSFAIWCAFYYSYYGRTWTGLQTIIRHQVFKWDEMCAFRSKFVMLVPKCLIGNMSALIQVIQWHLFGTKPLLGLIMTRPLRWFAMSRTFRANGCDQTESCYRVPFICRVWVGECHPNK